MGTTVLMQSLKPTLALRRKMMREKMKMKKNLTSMGVTITEISKIDLLEIGNALFFNIFFIGTSYEKKCEFAENELGQITLRFYSFNPTTGAYEDTGELKNFETFEVLNVSIILIAEMMK